MRRAPLCAPLQARTAFCAVRPPGHHAGPVGTVRNLNDAHGSHGFCLLSNVAIAAAYAMNVYRNQGEVLCAWCFRAETTGWSLQRRLLSGPGWFLVRSKTCSAAVRHHAHGQRIN